MSETSESPPLEDEMPIYDEEVNSHGLETHDVELIRWMLSMTPAERLRYAQRFAAGARKLRLARRT